MAKQEAELEAAKLPQIPRLQGEKLISALTQGSLSTAAERAMEHPEQMLQRGRPLGLLWD